MEHFLIDETNNPFLADTLIDVPLNEVENIENYLETVVEANGFPLKCLFLTYANPMKQGLEYIASMKEAIGFYLSRKDPQPVEVMVSEEHHQDGSLHYHALVQWAMQKKKVGPRYFDYQGVHPNIQVVRNYNAVRTYIQKEDKSAYHWVNFIDLDSDDEGFQE